MVTKLNVDKFVEQRNRVKFYFRVVKDKKGNDVIKAAKKGFITWIMAHTFWRKQFKLDRILEALNKPIDSSTIRYENTMSCLRERIQPYLKKHPNNQKISKLFNEVFNLTPAALQIQKAKANQEVLNAAHELLTNLRKETTAKVEAVKSPETPTAKAILTLVKAYQQGKKLTQDEYQKQYVDIMTKLGFKKGDILDPFDQPTEQDFQAVFAKLMEELKIKSDSPMFTFAELDHYLTISAMTDDEIKNASPRIEEQNRHLVGFAVHTGAHFSTVLYENGNYTLIPEVVSAKNHRGLEVERKISPKQTFNTKKAFLTWVRQYARPVFEVPESPDNPLHAGFIITCAQKNNSIEPFKGELPNLNTCVFESCISLLAKIVPVS